MKKNRVIYWTLVVALSLVIVVCVGLIAAKLIGDAQDKNEYDDLASIMQSAKDNAPSTPTLPPVTDPSLPTEPGDPPPTIPPQTMLYEMQVMYALNSDLVGWISIDGTSINYPVVQSPYQPNFYLRRDFYKKNATCGTVYARETCDVNAPSDNVTLYGHNMRNGTMFADLHKYKDPAFWASNRFVQFNTLTEYHEYEIFAVFSTTSKAGVGFRYHIFDDAATPEEFDEFVAKCKELSRYDTGITPEYGEKLLTLSTCDKEAGLDLNRKDGRLVVVCRRVS